MAFEPAPKEWRQGICVLFGSYTTLLANVVDLPNGSVFT
jgi:hypothetical protein